MYAWFSSSLSSQGSCTFEESIFLTLPRLSQDQNKEFPWLLLVSYIKFSTTTTKAKALWGKADLQNWTLWMRLYFDITSAKGMVSLWEALKIKFSRPWNNVPNFHDFYRVSMAIETLPWWNLKCFYTNFSNNTNCVDFTLDKNLCKKGLMRRTQQGVNESKCDIINQK